MTRRACRACCRLCRCAKMDILCHLCFSFLFFLFSLSFFSFRLNLSCCISSPSSSSSLFFVFLISDKIPVSYLVNAALLLFLTFPYSLTFRFLYFRYFFGSSLSVLCSLSLRSSAWVVYLPPAAVLSLAPSARHIRHCCSQFATRRRKPRASLHDGASTQDMAPIASN